jgi:hypothetical protein
MQLANTANATKSNRPPRATGHQEQQSCVAELIDLGQPGLITICDPDRSFMAHLAHSSHRTQC